ncbi:thiazole/oxazole-forming peptide maturase SagD family component [Streptomyces sp. 1114.5]|uniref:YcaO-like family protein n=1 Tax=Streptomyces sp. 1114.5 TaxID=1938830 RepID=UPI000EABE9F8|nr:YcaO-like family protein [Streptomyces sp. 1114.5]RKT11326.1 thiazole/oxazole-forming peptide maturase SagD family component [Streptomyces sp. 1114.5]
MSEATTLAPRVFRDEDERAWSLQARMHNRLCGLITSMGGFNRHLRAPRLFVEGAELTGVHLWQDRSAPKPGSYHIGGYGFVPFESRIRVLGETLERYAGHAVVAEGRLPVTIASHTEMVRRGEPVLEAEAFAFFERTQLSRKDFLYQAFDPAAPMGWIRVPSLTDDTEAMVPAQQFLLGYLPAAEEPWLVSAVTTGTAAHTSPTAALSGALHELVQIDTAVGHWHGTMTSVLIEPDHRLGALQAFINRHYQGTVAPEFHYLPNPDLPGFTVACLLRSRAGVVPAVSVGLGSGSSLQRAVYRSLLETVGVQALANWSFFQAQLDAADGKLAAGEERLDTMFDLESNVGYYASPEGAQKVEERFARSVRLPANDLPADDARSSREIVREVVDAFRRTGKRLYWNDLTSPDIRDLGFTVMRVWSPDTLSLPLPSAPPAAHRRFADYGGFVNPLPHPYP